MLSLIRFCLVFGLINFISFSTYAGINGITVEGNQRVDSDTIRSYLNFSSNIEATHDKVNESIKNLYATGLFNNVKITKDNKNIKVIVKENPIIVSIHFEGNKQIKSADLKTELLMKPRSVYSKNILKDDIAKLMDIYHKSGRYSVKINPKIIELEQNRIKIVYEIDEGSKAKIKKISFVGNTRYSDYKLAQVISSKEAAWYRIFSNTDSFDADRVEYDRELIRNFYMSNGYADIQVISSIAEFDKSKDEFYITFSLIEGDQYTFGNVDITTKIDNISKENLLKQVSTKKGDLFAGDEIQDSIAALEKFLADHGYAFVNVDIDFIRDLENKIISLKYLIEEGSKVYVNRININGNVRTKDKVLRREFRLSEGDAYNANKIERTEQRIRNLDFFDKVEINHVPSENDSNKVDINVEVKEKATAGINLGVGYSTTDHVIGKIGFSEPNLWGNGQDFAVNVTKASKKLDFDLSFTEPYLFDMPLEGGFDLFSYTSDRRAMMPYRMESKGGKIRMAYELSEYLTHSLKYTFHKDVIEDVPFNASIYIKEQEGNTIVSMIGQGFRYNRTVNKSANTIPTSGYLIDLYQDYAGVGGDIKYIRHEASAKYYHPVMAKDVILSLSASAGKIIGLQNNSHQVRINHRFFLHETEIRGFEFGGIGPRDVTYGDSLGGNTFYLGSAALNFPLGLPKEFDLMGSIFTDVGTVFGLGLNRAQKLSMPAMYDSSRLRASAGVSLLWMSKMGPITINVAKPYKKERFDKTQIFSINFSSNF